MTPSIQLKNVYKRLGDIDAVDHVSLEIEKGKFFSILGPSGCGKTTTLRLIGGLEVPESGEIFIGGKLVNNIPPYRRDCSIVFQNLALFPHMTVNENIRFGLTLKKVKEREINNRVSEMLTLMQLDGFENRRPKQLSGGQQQRVALARSIILQPEVLLLDEPLASLDRKLRDNMRVELRKIQKEVGITFIYVTHDLDEALSMSDQVAVMKFGKLLQVASPNELYENPKTRFVADFIGASNILTGKVTAKNGNDLKIETNNGLEFSASDTGQEKGQTINFSIRPGYIKICSIGSELEVDNVFVATVVEKVYLGDITEAIISLNNSEQVKVHIRRKSQADHFEIQIGDKIQAGWNKNDLNLLKD